MAVKLPSDSERHLIVGMTGSGKTQAAAHALSLRSFDQIPWLVVDFKGDELLNEIRGAEHVDLDWKPKKPGIFMVHPTPDEGEEVEALLMRVWERGSTGVYVDEGLLIGANSRAYRSIQTQGRTLRIPTITLVQRPVFVDRFLLSEASVFQIFYLNDPDDIKRVNGYMPRFDVSQDLPDYHSYWYRVGKKSLNVMLPVPDRDTILATFDERIPPKRTFI